MAHAVNPPGSSGRYAVAATKAFGLPGQRRTTLRPLFDQASLFGMGGALRSLPLRPIERAGRRVLRESRERQSDRAYAKKPGGYLVFGRHVSRIDRRTTLSLA